MRGALAVVLAAILAGCLSSSAPPVQLAQLPSVGMVASSQRLAAEAGAEILRAGGNAIDAAAAVQWALNVVEPSMSGLGGGSFIVLYLAGEKRVVTLDGRETAPEASTPDQFLDPLGEPQEYGKARRSGYAVGVPGTLAVFSDAVQRFGTMPLARTFEAAIRLAEQGFPVSERFHGYLDENKDLLGSWPASAEIYLRDATCIHNLVGCIGGRAPAIGETLRNTDLAATFRLLQREGTHAFYNGEIAEAIVETVKQREGRMVEADLSSYEAKERVPVRFTYDNFEIVSIGPPSSGGLTMGQILLLLEPFDLLAKGSASADAVHLAAEAMHLAYADRAAFMADADYVPVPTTGLLHPDYIASRRALIDPGRSNPNVGPGDPWRHEPYQADKRPQATPHTETGFHTTHFTIVDLQGNVASVTTTLENLFGTGMVVPGYGFLLNNQLTDFDWIPGGANQVEGGKRPRSSMTPTIVFRDGEPVLGLGAPGGATIIASVTQGLLNVVEFGLELPEAVAASRIYSPTNPDVYFEGTPDAALEAELERRGHNILADSILGTVNAVARTPGGSWMAVADARSSEAGVAYAS